jgi:UDP-3-O-[3-hydroxymyristoyl] glucosamine N-acyltransferase
LSAGGRDVLAFCDAERAADRLGGAEAAVVIVPEGSAAAPKDDQTFIAVADVRAAFIDTVGWLIPGCARPADPEPGIDPRAGAAIGWVGLAYHDRADGRRSFFPHPGGVRIGDRVDGGAATCICRGMLSHTSTGDDAKIGSLVYVSHGVEVAPRAWISPERQLQDMRRSRRARSSASARS